MNENNPFVQGIAGCLPILLGVIASLVGLVILLAGLNIIPFNLPSSEIPRWMLSAIGTMFFCIGIFAVTRAFPPATQQSALCQWLQYFALVGGLGAFSAIFLWVGFGPGEREFESSTTIGPFTTSGKGDELIGRVLFGGFGLLTGLGTLWIAISRPLHLLGIWQTGSQNGESK